jgi:hypothetical protein
MNGNRGSKHFIYMNRTFFGFIQFNVWFKGKWVSTITKIYKMKIELSDIDKDRIMKWLWKTEQPLNLSNCNLVLKNKR